MSGILFFIFASCEPLSCGRPQVVRPKLRPNLAPVPKIPAKWEAQLGIKKYGLISESLKDRRTIKVPLDSQCVGKLFFKVYSESRPSWWERKYIDHPKKCQDTLNSPQISNICFHISLPLAALHLQAIAHKLLLTTSKVDSCRVVAVGLSFSNYALRITIQVQVQVYLFPSLCTKCKNSQVKYI